MKDCRRTLQSPLLRLLVTLQRHRHQEEGYTLVVTIGMVLVITSLLATSAVMGRIEQASTSATSTSEQGFSGAEAGLNLRAEQISNAFEGFNQPSGTAPNSWEDCLDNDAGNNGTGDFACDNSLKFQGQTIATYVVGETSGSPDPIIIPQDERFGGLSAQEYRYDAYSAAVHDVQDTPSSILRMTFRSRLIPLFQFAAFYDKDLEIVPNSALTFGGQIHTNGDLYLNSANTLNITEKISISGVDPTQDSLYRGRKDSNTCGGTVNVNDPTNPLGLNCSGGSRTAITDVSSWNNQIRLGVDPVVVPPLEILDPDNDTEGEYWKKADLRIVLELDSSGLPSTIEVRNQDGSSNTTATTALDSCAVDTILANDGDATPAYEASDTVLNVTDASIFAVNDVIAVQNVTTNIVTNVNTGTNQITLKTPLNEVIDPTINPIKVLKAPDVSTTKNFINNRESNTNIRMLNIDIRGLLDCASTTALMGSIGLDDTSDDGLVWFFTIDDSSLSTPLARTDVTNTTSDPDKDPNNGVNSYGVRLYNGRYLSATSGSTEINGLTVVSDQALYLQGDYNLNADDPSTSSITEAKKPAALLADTINVLSNAWDVADSQSSDPRANRDATTTTINAAFLGGTDTTGGTEGSGGQGGTFNGGLANLPRFHEDWSGATLTYQGSFVSLGKPRRVNGTWISADAAYDPSPSAWSFDTQFSNAANLPPLTPQTAYVVQERFTTAMAPNPIHPQRLKRASLFPFNILALLPAFRPHVP